MKATENRVLLYIIIIAVVVRLIALFLKVPRGPEAGYSHINSGIATQYHLSAKNLLEHSIFSVSLEAPFLPEAHLTPGYPLFIAFHYFLFGIEPWTVLLSQVMLQIFLILGIFMFAREIRLRSIAISVACVIAAVDLTAIAMSVTLLTEAVFTLLILYATFFLVKCRNVFKWRYLFVSSLLLSVAIYFKPGARFLMPVFTGIIFLVSYKDSLRSCIKRSLIFLLICFSILAPWIVRNIIIFREPQLSYHLHVHLRDHAKEALVEANNISDEEAYGIIDSRLSSEIKERYDNPWKRYREDASVYRSIISENFDYWIKATLRNSALVYVIPGTTRIIEIFTGSKDAEDKNISTGRFFWIFKNGGIIKGIQFLIYKKGIFLVFLILFIISLNLTVLISGSVGLITIFKLDRISLFILLLIFLSFISNGPIMDPRYKLPSLWTLAIFSGAGLDFILSRFRKGSIDGPLTEEEKQGE